MQTKEGVPYTITAASGRATVHADPIQSAAMAAVLMGLDGIDDATARAMTARNELLLAPSMTGACMHYGGDLYYAALDGSAARRLTYTPEAKEQWVEFSPDGQYVAFIRMHELYVVHVATATERPLTTGASEVVANGEMNWVYMEEVYGRGTQQAYWWSPDSTRIAFLQFDETPVSPFGLINHLPDVQEIEFSRYPKAGEPNPHVRLGIVPVAGGEVVWADLTNYAPDDRLITRVGWQPDSARLWCYMQNRAQTFLDVLTVTLTDGATQRLCRDENGQWVASSRPPTWLTDGSFLLLSERTGWRHLYHYSAAGVLIRPVTAGPWEVTSLESVDEAHGVLFVCGTRDSHLARHLYRVRLDGSALTRLTHADGTHQVTVSPGGRYYIDTWSDIQLPPRVALFQGNNGALVRRLDTNPVYAAEAWELGQYALVQIPTADGCLLDGNILYPPDFDPKQRYPVWVQVYGGPHAPRIRKAFISRERDQLLANWGLIVFCVDPRSASSKGAISTWTAYRRLGVVECADLVTALEWLTTHPWVDGARMGMQGHSYGGFMTAYMMTHTRLLRAGVAGAPITDWRLYDTIYTERYMDTPQRNPSGYDDTSVLQAAANLHGRLLIVHGVLDNNVHMQHTMRLIDALQQANKQNFEIMVYPRHRHGLDSQHARDLVLNFIRRELLGLGPVGAEEVRHSMVCNVADGQ